jgi:hypothetical protein
MMKEFIIEQLKAAHNTTSWQVPLSTAVSGLTQEQALWRSEGDTNNSIFEIVSHLIFWNERNLNKFRGVPLTPMNGDNTSTFENTENYTWEAAINKLDIILSEWEEAISGAGENKLSGPAFEDTSAGNWYSVISNLSLHNAYHTGQIVVLRKLQGCWDSSKGVS